MWRSMTGYGRGEAHDDAVSITVEARSVNHRYLEPHVRCPSRYLAWELRVRALVRDAVKRGKVDLSIAVKEWGKSDATVRVNRGLLASFVAEVDGLRHEGIVTGPMSVRDLLGVSDLFIFQSAADDPVEERWPLAEKAVGKALAMLSESRAEEGERLRAIIRDGLDGIAGITGEIAGLTVDNKNAAALRLRERLAALLSEPGIDPARVAQEVALLVDRLDVTEEVQRLGSHVTGLRSLLAVDGGGEAVGKRFDFLLQEVFRELNTAGSKSAHVGIAERIVRAKTELEKVREQIQNVE